jgi:uncharacterized NAD-dependent epimerase/dehydratase family protein
VALWCVGGLALAKTATALLRHGRRFEVVAVVDGSATAAEPFDEVPLVRSFAEALCHEPRYLVLAAPSSSSSPECLRPELRASIEQAIELGLSIVSTLYFRISEDRALADLARQRGVELVEARRVPRSRWLSGRGRELGHKVVLTVGNDLSCGKMTTAFLLAEAGRARGLSTAFVATGHTGWLLGAEASVAVEMVRGDFMAGAVEEAILSVADAELIIVEGQSCLSDPAFSTVALALLRGATPSTLVACYEARRTARVAHPELPYLSIDEELELYEELAKVHGPTRVAALSVLGRGLSDHELHEHVVNTEARTGHPVSDPVRLGVSKLLDAILDPHGPG